MGTVILTFVIMGLAIGFMAIGVIVRKDTEKGELQDDPAADRNK